MQAKSAFIGQSSVADIQIQKKISHVLITCLGDPIVNEKITVGLTVAGSGVAILPKGKVRDYAVHSQFENGYLSTTKLADGKTLSEWVIALTPNHTSIELSGNDYISIAMDDLNLTSTYTINGLEAPDAQRLFLQTSVQAVTGVEPTQRNIRVAPNAKNLLIRNNGGLQSLRLWFKTGEECTYLPSELRAITRELNGVTESSDKLIEGDVINQTILGGAEEFYFYPLDAVSAYEVSTVGGIDVIIFTQEIKSF